MTFQLKKAGVGGAWGHIFNDAYRPLGQGFRADQIHGCSAHCFFNHQFEMVLEEISVIVED